MATAYAVPPRQSAPDCAHPAPVVDIDAALMLRVRDGDTACFNQLIARHRAPVMHFLFRMVRNHAIAEELTQDVFLRVYRSRAAYQPSARFTTWLYRISTNRAFNWIRDQRSRRPSLGYDEPLDSVAARALSDGQPSAESTLVYGVRLAGNPPGHPATAPQAARGRAHAQIPGA